MDDRQRLVREMRAALAIVPPDEWTTEDCAAVLAVYTEIARCRMSEPGVRQRGPVQGGVMNAAPLKLHDRIQRELKVVRPEEWRVDEASRILEVLTKITEGRSAAVAEAGGNVVPIGRRRSAPARV